MTDNVIHAKSQEDVLQALKNESLVVIEFYAKWCGPCRFIAPKIAEFSTKYKATFVHVDIDIVPSVSGIDDILIFPTFKLYKNGAFLTEVSSADEVKLQAAIEAHVN